MAVVPADAIPQDQPPKTTSLAALRTKPAPEQSVEVSIGFTSSRGFELMQRSAKALMSSSLVPDAYKNNLGNCCIALEMAHRIGASALMVTQNLYVVHGRPGWSAKFLIATFNACRRYAAIKYRWVGEKGKDSYGCQAYTTELATGERIEGPVITWELVKAEGWHSKAGSKWKTMPEKMFMYRAGAWLIDTTAPEISMGIQTAEELSDTYEATRTADGTYTVTTEDLREVSRVIDGGTGEIISLASEPTESREPGQEG